MPNTLLTIEDLQLGYQDRQGDYRAVLRGVSLTLAPREILGVVGESGCGKSTLAMAMLGLLRGGSRVTAGEVRVNGAPLTLNEHRPDTLIHRHGICLIPQQAGQALTPHLTIGSQLQEMLRLHQGSGDHKDGAIALLEQVRLPAPASLLNRYPHQLSGGQQQRVVIAMALAAKPRLLLMDEPTTGLDATTQVHVLHLLRQLRNELNTSIVFISHDLGAVSSLCDRVAVMYAGHLVETADKDALIAHPRHPYTHALLAASPGYRNQGLPPELPGAPPAVGSRFEGCPFAGRCASVQPKCRQHMPSLSAREGVACHFPHQVTTDLPAIGHTPPRPDLSQDTPLLQVSELAIRYQRPGWLDKWRQHTVINTVDDVSFSLSRGQTLALIGESGSGKSSILKAIAGINPIQAGQSLLNGDVLGAGIETRTRAQKRNIQLIFQHPDAALNPRLTLFQSLAPVLQTWFGLQGDECRRQAGRLLQEVKLNPDYLDRLPGQLSGGELQRAAIARALAARPGLLLCDEVTSALDVSVQAAILRLLARLQRDRNIGILFITHDLSLVRHFADKVAVLYKGRLMQLCSTRQLQSGPLHPYTRLLLNATLTPGTPLPAADADVAQEPGLPARGCAFQGRCPHARPGICDQRLPPIQSGENGWLRCHLPPETLAAEAPMTQEVA
ncbi:ABC transporter ATP-binding protein [Oceanimonas sp. MB9]|uniref:ABC transporter ATP-binding protein n=1 Tax=Oceanimonas sp. MB9 TaxID=2588453 RepID=UPI0013F5EF61|nr:ABC transporter ATP-binding protein [Oceanimonas sp. MB9]NHI01070.1 Glutathione import ATP-binding protein GsiA [Oceanimonas sp. MB9]